MVITLVVISHLSHTQVSTNYRASDPTVPAIIKSAVENSRNFIQLAMNKAVSNRHFKLNERVSRAIDEGTKKESHFKDSLDFKPTKYDVAYSVVINRDTLVKAFLIPVDATGNVTVDTSKFSPVWDDLKAFGKLFSGKYTYGHSFVQGFVLEKNMKSYTVQFMSFMAVVGYDSPHYTNYKHYWFINDYSKVSSVTQYMIDPMTGDVTTKKFKN